MFASAIMCTIFKARAIAGLDEENYQMMKAFPQHQTQSRQWYTGWELNYDGSLSGIDYGTI